MQMSAADMNAAQAYVKRRQKAEGRPARKVAQRRATPDAEPLAEAARNLRDAIDAFIEALENDHA